LFKPVQNNLELKIFNHIWTTVWKEKGYELEYSDQVFARYLIITSEGRAVGTTEIKPFIPSISPILKLVEHSADFLELANTGHVGEIDKVALLPNYRGRYTSDLLSSLIHYFTNHHQRYFVSLLEPIFSRALRISYHIPMEQIGPKTYYKGDDVIPFLFDSKQIANAMNEFNWLKMPS